MRITFSQLLIVMLMTGLSYSKPTSAQTILNKKINITVENKTLADVLKLLTQKHQVEFVYNQDVIQTSDKMSVTFADKDLKEVLDKLLTRYHITYQVFKNKIILINTQQVDDPGSVVGAMQDIQIKGNVVDETGQPLVGVSVGIKGTTKGTVTDAHGVFSIAVRSTNDVLVFKYIGFVTLEIPASGTLPLTIKLTTDSKALSEVVVIGYGSKKKIDLTGTVSSLQADEIVRAKATGTQEAMQGRIAGVDIKRSSGKPGSDYSIEIRGANSITGNTQPLYVIDGVPVAINGSPTNPINDINPADIERIDVLKDASSTAIYGSRGANGVILVTTKRGTKGNTKITYDGYSGVVNPYHLPPVMDGPKFVAYVRDFFNAQAGYPDTPIPDSKLFSATELTNIQNGTYTNWVDLIKRNGSQSNQNIAITGGDDKTTYFTSAGYQLYQGTTKGEDSKKYTLKAGLDKTINNTFKAGASIYSAFVNNHLGSAEVFRSAYRLRPTGSAYNADGSPRFFAYESETQITNPLFEFNNEIRQQQYVHVLPNVYVEANLMKGLKIRTSFSPDLTFQRQGQYDDTFTKQQAGTKPALGQSSTNQYINYTWENLLIYNGAIGRHKFDVTLGNTFEYHQQDFSSISAQGLPYRSLWYNLGSATTITINGNAIAPITTVNSGYSQQNLTSYFGRANYTFNNRYLFTATMRADANSVFAAGHKWGYFPSGSFAWIASEEDFLKNIQSIGLLKFRLSYGKSGNASSVMPYATQATVSQSPYDFNGVAASGFAPNFGNQNLTWEKTDEYNAGMELGLWKNRINLDVNVYRKTSKGSILNQQVPPENGYSSQTTNLGSVRNQGIEVSLNTVNINNGKFSWTTNFNFAANSNKILQLYGDGKDDIGNAWFLGRKVREIYNYKIIGVWQTSEAAQAAVYGAKPGQYKIQDVNNDGKIDATNDRQILGSSIPNWFGGFTNTMNYANFDFSFTVYTRQGTYENSVFLEQLLNGDQNRARFGAFDRSYWTPTNPSNQWSNKAVNPSDPANTIAQFQNSSYTKISNITLGYTIPKKLLSRLKISNLRIYANAFNPFIFSKFIGWDPENPSGNSALNQDFRTRTFMLGLNVTL
ncbi:SusC/RagA family TonB-linked outer membrane protein [Mucilaginibacter sp. SP1R1]|uniref:SusC/RagA family TonB-linked outer membrane protein n=1 Tax=Mucilaginibacter sp. SP1R1 TaxID=2723091 RepID=UPI001622FAAE|nr:SusC/RagA family TonB-linked outer membrane protein [Mucilaginibacter sp. SP1R1]